MNILIILRMPSITYYFSSFLNALLKNNYEISIIYLEDDENKDINKSLEENK